MALTMSPSVQLGAWEKCYCMNGCVHLPPVPPQSPPSLLPGLLSFGDYRTELFLGAFIHQSVTNCPGRNAWAPGRAREAGWVQRPHPRRDYSDFREPPSEGESQRWPQSSL